LILYDWQRNIDIKEMLVCTQSKTYVNAEWFMDNVKCLFIREKIIKMKSLWPQQWIEEAI
jgi:hypothetical protein